MQTNSTNKNNWQSVLLFTFLLIGMVVYLGMAVLMLISGGISLITPQAGAISDFGINFTIACGFGFCGLALLPGVFFSFQRMTGKTYPPYQPRPAKLWLVLVLTAVWAGSVWLSDYLWQNVSLGWLASAPFYIISIALPLFLLIWIGLGGIPLESRNRLWGSLGIGMTLGPFLAAVLELLAYLAMLVILIIILAFNPVWLNTLLQVVTKIRNLSNLQADNVMQIIAPFLLNPFILISLFLALGLVTPLIEETIKPTIVWLTANRLKSPSQGFALGVVSGAGFALVESLLATSTGGQGWGALLAVRAGGGLMHIFASGLMGWGIASAWKGKRLRLLGTYIVSVLVHGIWNGAAIIIEVGSLQPYLTSQVFSKYFDTLTSVGSVILGGLMLVALVSLLLINRKMRKSIPVVQVPPPPMI